MMNSSGLHSAVMKVCKQVAHSKEFFSTQLDLIKPQSLINSKSTGQEFHEVEGLDVLKQHWHGVSQDQLDNQLIFPMHAEIKAA